MYDNCSFNHNVRASFYSKISASLLFIFAIMVTQLLHTHTCTINHYILQSISVVLVNYNYNQNIYSTAK